MKPKNILLDDVGFGIDTFGVGIDTGSPVSNTYQPPFAFTGTINEVRIELK